MVEINGIPMSEKSDEEIQLIAGTIREDMELTTRSYSTRNHMVEMAEMQNRSGSACGSGGKNVVEFGPVNQWCFDEESWPGPRTGEVSAKKAYKDDLALIELRGFRMTMAGSTNPAAAVADIGLTTPSVHAGETAGNNFC